jgi:hypothetical protein
MPSKKHTAPVVDLTSHVQEQTPQTLRNISRDLRRLADRFDDAAATVERLAPDGQVIIDAPLTLGLFLTFSHVTFLTVDAAIAAQSETLRC